MVKKSIPKPTDGELEILTVLWAFGPSTVRAVFEELKQSKPMVYTTVLKLMQIMHQKGILARDASEKSHVYKPALSQQITQRQIIREVLDHAFDGRSEDLVLQLLQSRRAKQAEINRIKAAIRKYEKK